MRTLDYILLGVVVGAIGQGARAAVGIQKARRESSPEELDSGDWWDPARLYSTLLIGGVAGALAVIVDFETVKVFIEDPQETHGRGFLLSLLGAGYAGTDFIEGALKEYIPSSVEDGDGQGEVESEDGDAESS